MSESRRSPTRWASAWCATASLAGSNKAGSLAYKNPPTVYYRITVRVTGPKSAAAFVQALVLK